MTDLPDSEPDWLRLDAQLCFRLYAASRAVTQCYQPLLGELGLTYPQYLVMLVLWERDALPVKDISARLRLDPSTLTPLLKRLEAGGWITRRRRPDNEREVLIALTDSGRKLRERAKTVPPALMSSMNLPMEVGVGGRVLVDRLIGYIDGVIQGVDA